MDDDIVLYNASAAFHHSKSLAWRQRALELAVERHVLGQARRLYADLIDNYIRYVCVSASEQKDYELLYWPNDDVLQCTCEAGKRGNACCHAGAVFALIRELAEPRERNQEGFTDGNAR